MAAFLWKSIYAVFSFLFKDATYFVLIAELVNLPLNSYLLQEDSLF